MASISAEEVAKFMSHQPARFWRFVLLVAVGLAMSGIVLLVSGSLAISRNPTHWSEMVHFPAEQPLTGILLANAALAFLGSAAMLGVLYLLFQLIEGRQANPFDDALTPLREALVGEWKMNVTQTQRSADGQQLHQVILGQTGQVQIGIEPILKKLYIKLIWPNFKTDTGAGFRGKEELIYGISINVFANSPNVFIYHEFSDLNDPNSNRKIFMNLKINRGTNPKTISELAGVWYDLNCHERFETNDVSFARLN